MWGEEKRRMENTSFDADIRKPMIFCCLFILPWSDWRAGTKKANLSLHTVFPLLLSLARFCGFVPSHPVSAIPGGIHYQLLSLKCGGAGLSECGRFPRTEALSTFPEGSLSMWRCSIAIICHLGYFWTGHLKTQVAGRMVSMPMSLPPTIRLVNLYQDSPKHTLMEGKRRIKCLETPTHCQPHPSPISWASFGYRFANLTENQYTILCLFLPFGLERELAELLSVTSRLPVS